jgi:hypothetical protein
VWHLLICLNEAAGATDLTFVPAVTTLVEKRRAVE